MSRTSKALTVGGVGLALAVALVALAFFVASWLGVKNRFFETILAPGIALWQLSNWLCPPYGERCFLLSERMGAHHLWGLMCYIGAWWAIFSAFIAAVWALTAASSRTRARAARAGNAGR